MRIGAHVSAAGGIDKAVGRAVAIGAEAVQIFPAAPQSWRPASHSEAAIAAYREKAETAGIGPTFFHGIYLVNLASDNEEILAKGIESLTAALNLAPLADADGVIFHVGSHKGAGLDAVFGRVVGAVETILAGAPPDVLLCLENNAGQGQQIGARLEELGRIINTVGDPRLAVCLDTCHAFASGYDVTDADALARMMDEFESEIGLARLKVCHANDSKGELGGNRDRHENIGEGYIGLDGWRTFMAHPAMASTPLLLEVPGMDGKSGPDQENINRLKTMRSQLGLDG